MTLKITTALLCAAAWLPAASPCTVDRANGTSIDPQPLLRGAYGTRWNHAIGRVAYMQPGASGYYRLFTMKPDATDRRPLTEGLPGLPPKHQGMVYWHPSGRYLLFTAEKQEWHSPKLFGAPDYEALPGFGLHDDIWLIAPSNSRLWRLTNDANTRDQGILLPVFSADGTKVAWSQRQPGKKYTLKIADFVETPEPHLANIRSFEPGGKKYYEPGSFTSDSASLLYTSDQETGFWRSQIFRLDLATGRSVRLTVGNAYNEHPVVVKAPSGDWVVYMSDLGAGRFPGSKFLGTDWYAMRLDGSGAKRLTKMNVNRPDNPQNTHAALVATTIAPSPSGEYALGDVQDSLARQTGMVKVVRFTCP